MVREAGLACNLSLHFDDCESIEKKKNSVPTSSVLWVLYLRLPTVLFKKNSMSVVDIWSPAYHQHQLIPSVSTGSTTTTGTSRALSFKCFSSCIPYTKCIENFIYRVVPCSNDQVVCFIKDSLVEHNHCCLCTSMRNMTCKQRKIMTGFRFWWFKVWGLFLYVDLTWASSHYFCVHLYLIVRM